MKYKSIAFFLAHRFLFSKNESYSIKTILWVCIITITIGTAALTLIFGIMQGFESETENKLQSIHPQITLQSPTGEYLNFPKIKNYLKKIPEIESFAPSTSKFGAIHNPEFENQIELTNISTIKGINPKLEKLVNNLHTKINSQKTLNESITTNKVLVGKALAQSLDLEVGDHLIIFTPTKTNTRTKKISFDQIDATLGGTFKTGISEFDNNLVITSLQFMEESFDDFGISEIGIKLKTNSNEKKVIAKIKSDLKLEVYSWKEPYAAIVSALNLEKHVGTIIAFLIVLIACMTLISLLFMLITKHTKNIAILKILGLPQNKIKQTFIILSVLTTFFASSVGVFIAILCSILIKEYYIIDLPDVYYITTLPIQISILSTILIIITTTTIAFVVAHIPLKLISNLNISKVLKSNN